MMDTSAAMKAQEKIAEAVPLRELADEVRTYPLRLLRLLAEQQAARNGPVPDHALRLPPYLGETALRGLVEGGFIERAPQAMRSIYSYAPTQAGLDLLALVDAGDAGEAKAKRPARKRATSRSRASG